MKTIISSLIGVALLSGCATMGGWEPVVDREVDKHPEAVDKDLEQCRQLATKASTGQNSATKRDAGNGAVGGAAIGGFLGLLGGHPFRGAAAGGVIGAGAGAGHGGLSNNDQYKTSYIKCMEGRGHRVVS